MGGICAAPGAARLVELLPYCRQSRTQERATCGCGDVGLFGDSAWHLSRGRTARRSGLAELAAEAHPGAADASANTQSFPSVGRCRSRRYSASTSDQEMAEESPCLASRQQSGLSKSGSPMPTPIYAAPWSWTFQRAYTKSSA